MLINIEGIDGSGKNTQTERLEEYFISIGKDVLKFSYPDYESIFGQYIYEFLHGNNDMDNRLQFLMYLVDMVKDNNIIANALTDNYIVLLDRYYPSTIAYQSANGFNYEKAKIIINELEMIAPNHIIFLDIPPEVSVKRKYSQKGYVDKFEENINFLSKVKGQFDKLINEKFPIAWTRIDGMQIEDNVFVDILKSLGV